MATPRTRATACILWLRKKLRGPEKLVQSTHPHNTSNWSELLKRILHTTKSVDSWIHIQWVYRFQDTAKTYRRENLNQHRQRVQFSNITAIKITQERPLSFFFTERLLKKSGARFLCTIPRYKIQEKAPGQRRKNFQTIKTQSRRRKKFYEIGILQHNIINLVGYSPKQNEGSHVLAEW